MNEGVGKNKQFQIKVEKKLMIWKFVKKQFFKCIGFVISEVIYSKKVGRIWFNSYKS